MKYILNKPLCIYELGGRTNQEDFQIPSDDGVTADSRLFILCDGMGGHESGEVASRTVSETMYEWIERHRAQGKQITIDLFNEALAAAYDALDEKDKSTTERKMGTTMTFLMLTDEGAMVAHIGDSRVYQFRPGHDKPLFKTRDHSLVNDLVSLGEITEEEAKTAPNRNVITRAMQPHQDRRAKADIAMLTDVRPNDWFYMCSDGMLEQMEDYELLKLVTDPNLSDEEKKNELIRRTEDNKDNHTAFLIHVKDVFGGADRGEENADEVPVAVVVGVDESSSEMENNDPKITEKNQDEPKTLQDKSLSENVEPNLPEQKVETNPSLLVKDDDKHGSHGHFLLGIGLIAVLGLLVWFLLFPQKSHERKQQSHFCDTTNIADGHHPSETTPVVTPVRRTGKIESHPVPEKTDGMITADNIEENVAEGQQNEDTQPMENLEITNGGQNPSHESKEELQGEPSFESSRTQQNVSGHSSNTSNSSGIFGGHSSDPNK